MMSKIWTSVSAGLPPLGGMGTPVVFPESPGIRPCWMKAKRFVALGLHKLAGGQVLTQVRPAFGVRAVTGCTGLLVEIGAGCSPVFAPGVRQIIAPSASG
jgi:hypothetical protein